MACDLNVWKKERETAYKAFNQVMLQRRFMVLTEAISIANKCLLETAGSNTSSTFSNNPVKSPEDLQKFVCALNQKLADVHLTYKQMIDESTGDRLLCLINTISRELSRLVPVFTEAENAYFVKLVAMIVESRCGFVNSTEALNAVISMPHLNLSTRQAEELINAFIREDYFVSREGKIMLSGYAMVELEPYLVTIFKDYLERCCVCKQIALQAKWCSSETCEARMHNHCFSRFFSASKTRRTCPVCSGEF